MKARALYLVSYFICLNNGIDVHKRQLVEVWCVNKDLSDGICLNFELMRQGWGYPSHEMTQNPTARGFLSEAIMNLRGMFKLKNRKVMRNIPFPATYKREKFIADFIVKFSDSSFFSNTIHNMRCIVEIICDFLGQVNFFMKNFKSLFWDNIDTDGEEESEEEESESQLENICTIRSHIFYFFV